MKQLSSGPVVWCRGAESDCSVSSDMWRLPEEFLLMSQLCWLRSVAVLEAAALIKWNDENHTHRVAHLSLHSGFMFVIVILALNLPVLLQDKCSQSLLSPTETKATLVWFGWWGPVLWCRPLNTDMRSCHWLQIYDTKATKMSQLHETRGAEGWWIWLLRIFDWKSDPGRGVLYFLALPVLELPNSQQDI